MAKLNAYVKQINGISFAGRTDSNHWITMDGPEDFGGNNAGIRPKELMLLAIAGCTGSDVVSILQKKRVNVRTFEIKISADQTDDHPKVFTALHIEYIFKGKDIKEADVQRAIELSQTKYCGVTKMYEKAMTVTHSYTIENEE
ncbi:MAG: OsmC family protein [Ignavibacteriales bacterium]|nr:MAG: osmotically inducible protein OsmC [Ignavibacteriaceae bacterium]MBW7871835.1 OsmC family protein [Ignavibacteria bacterium]MCZ2144315.1 OsmC family protein [Ignavibacteriales bacterium]OQY75984.1 MAG: osmotically inducible protein OsmC [Ignavibacteriales bacterium UTCHB3]MBV6446268.1 Protein YhfA [Ignavibacteriaceae bacterium]